MGTCHAKNKVIPETETPELCECQMKDLLCEYNQFVRSFLGDQNVKKRLTHQLCKDHHAIHDRYHVLYKKVPYPDLYDVHFETTYNSFVDQLQSLYKSGNLEIANELKTSTQIRMMFDLDERDKRIKIDM
jgi:hypothetical protein